MFLAAQIPFFMLPDTGQAYDDLQKNWILSIWHISNISPLFLALVLQIKLYLEQVNWCYKKKKKFQK